MMVVMLFLQLIEDDEVLAVTEKGVITCDNFEPYCSYEPSDDDDIFENQYNEMSSAGCNYSGAPVLTINRG